MCGIVGYVGKQQAYPILIKGLHRLEYRGYDSAGLALVNREGVLNVFKSKGKVADLEHFVESKDLDGTIGIAHTRWATHGEPNDINAHPHYSDSGNIALIHNGIIENYRVLKEALIENGYTFKSDTDTEVLVNLIEYIRTSNNCTLLEAVQQALKQVIGAYAIAVVEKGNQDQIIAARRSSPMVIGIGDKEFFLASDAASIVEYTDKIVYVNDGEVVVMDRNHPLKIVTLDNQESKIDIKKLQLSISQLEKGGYPHFMLKEIFEQPKTIVDCIRGRINPETYDVILSGIMDNRERFLNARRIIFVACGTSWHASLIGEYLIEDFCRIPVEVEYASEFRYRNPVIYPDDIVIAGMGGETICAIMAAAPWLPEGRRLILQPQSKVAELTDWLWRSGFTIEDAALCRDSGKRYLALRVLGRSSEQPCTVEQLLLRRADPLLPEYLTDEIRRQTRARAGMAHAKQTPEAALAALDARLNELQTCLKEVTSWQP